MITKPVVPALGGSLPDIIVALDIGGTKTHGVRFEQGKAVVDIVVGSANVQNVSRKTALANLAHLFGTIGHDKIDRVYVGAGGVDTKDDASALELLIAPFAPGAAVVIVHDSRLLLAAGGVDSGVAVIAGTGSAVWGLNQRGVEARVGGWGYLLGDEGSGYWLGREAVRHSLARMNQGDEPDELTLALLAACAVDHPNKLIALFHSSHTGRQYWAKHAKLVVAAADAGHQASQLMIFKAASELARMTVQALSELELPGPVILGGGLGVHSALLQLAFRDELAAAGIHDVRVIDQAPVYGTPVLAELLR